MTDDPPKKFRIYTRSGDGGSSCLYTGQKLGKDSAYFQAMGDVDEVNSCIGIAREFAQPINIHLAEQLATIQSRLIDVGSALATPANTGQTRKVNHTRFGSQHTSTLEKWIDAMDDTLPPLRHFILPSGGHAAVFLHQARSVCRRAERSVVALARVSDTAIAADKGTADSGAVSEDSVTGAEQQGGDNEEAIDVDVRIYLNRLSDYLFTAARYMAYKEGRSEQTYQKAAVAL